MLERQNVGGQWTPTTAFKEQDKAAKRISQYDTIPKLESHFMLESPI